MSEAALAEAGHNEPPADLDPLLERLREDHADLIRGRARLLGRIGCSPSAIEEGDEELAGRLADFVDKELRAFVKHAEAAHKHDKAPFLQASRTVDSFLHSLIDDINDGKAAVNAVRKAYADAKAAKERRRREEDWRLAREEQKRLEREAAGKAAQIKEEDDLNHALQPRVFEYPRAGQRAAGLEKFLVRVCPRAGRHFKRAVREVLAQGFQVNRIAVDLGNVPKLLERRLPAMDATRFA